MGEDEIKEVMAFAIDYCQRNGTNVTTQEMYEKWQEALDEALPFFTVYGTVNRK